MESPLLTKGHTMDKLSDEFPKPLDYDARLARDQLLAFLLALETPLKSFADVLDADLLLPPEHMVEAIEGELPNLLNLITLVEQVRYNYHFIGHKHLTDVIKRLKP
jgi:hypothetical protein